MLRLRIYALLGLIWSVKSLAICVDDDRQVLYVVILVDKEGTVFLDLQETVYLVRNFE